MIKLIMKKISTYVALIGVAIGFYLLFFLSQKGPEPQPVAMPAINPFADAIAASGIIEPYNNSISIATPVSGIVDQLNVDVGDKVHEGDVLFTIDGRDLQAQLLVNKADVTIAKANLQRLQDQLDRLKSVEDPRAVSGDEVKTRQNDVVVSMMQLQSSEAKVRQYETLIDRLIIRAPKDGTILQTNIEKGEYLSSMAALPAVLMGDTTRLQVRVDIDEQNASRFRSDQRAIAYPKNNTTLSIPLRFDYIEPYVVPKHSLTGSSEERVDTRVLQVIYSFDHPEDFHVYVGQQVDVFILTSTKEK